MPLVLELSTEFWSLDVWTSSIERSQLRLKKVVSERGANLPCQEIRLKSQPNISAKNFIQKSTGVLTAEEPVFFENKAYEFEFKVAAGVSNLEILHIQRKVEDSFRPIIGGLRGTINFGNEIGWFKLDLKFTFQGEVLKTESLSVRVFPTKLDMPNDIEKIHSVIDDSYPLWRFSFAKKTNHELAISRNPQERFPLLWLAQFEYLREQLVKNVKTVCLTPHKKLTLRTNSRRVEKIKGKLSPRIENSVVQARSEKLSNKYFHTKISNLSLDTLENRFVKMALQSMSHQLNKILTFSVALNRSPEYEVISESFLKKLNAWREELKNLLGHPLFQEVGDFENELVHSQVLFNKPGYSKIYRIWQDLKAYLAQFGAGASISHRSVNELYEIWCLLEIKRILIDLGFKEIQISSNVKIKNWRSQLSIESNFSSFSFERDDGLVVRLAHEPVFGKPSATQNGIYSWSAIQKPDIVLQAIFPDGENVHWIFDAKYRIEESWDESQFDVAPEDAINQMHRYRDALIKVESNLQGGKNLSRPVVGAYVLFPGWFPDDLQNGSLTHPYSESISTVGIGGFPALPGQKNRWLSKFIDENLGVNRDKNSYKSPDFQLAQRSVRIPPSGLELRRSGELVLVATTGLNRSSEYIENFKNGTALWYHTRDKTVIDANISQSVIRDISHLLIFTPEEKNQVVATHIFSISFSELKSRSLISEEQSGTPVATDSGNYWLFNLGKATPLQKPLYLSAEEHFRFGFCTFSELNYLKSWEDISSRYAFLNNQSS